LLLSECLLLLLFISLLTQSGNFWIHPRTGVGSPASHYGSNRFRCRPWNRLSR